MWARGFLVGCACLTFSALALGQVYKWVDERGVTHYGERPPNPQSAAKVAGASSPPPAPLATPEGPATAAGSASPRSATGMGRAQSSQGKVTVRAGNARTGQPSQAPQPSAQPDPRASAAARCKANRGVDCDSAAGLRQWMDEERPMTKEDQKRIEDANAARRFRQEERCWQAGKRC